MTLNEPADRVLVIETGSVLDGAIKSLMMGKPELQVAILAYVDLPEILKEVSNALPNVIVVSEGDEADWARNSGILHGLSPEQPLRMIVIRLDDNILEVYDKQGIRAIRNEDLITVVRHRPGENAIQQQP